MKAGQVPEKQTVRERLSEINGVGAEQTLEDDVDNKEQKKERESAEPPAGIEKDDVPGLREIGAGPDQDLADQESAQDKEQFHAVKTAVAEEAERVAKMRVEHDEPVRADHHHDGRGPEKIETEDAVGGTRIHRWIERSALDGKKSRRSCQINIERRSARSTPGDTLIALSFGGRPSRYPRFADQRG